MAVTSERRRAHVVLPDELVKEVDERVGQRRRSRFIREAVEEKLSRRRPRTAPAEMEGAQAGAEIPGWQTPKSGARWMRTSRRDGESRSASSTTTAPRRRAHVAMPQDVIEEVDDRVGPRHRSEFILDAVREQLRRLRRVEAFDRAVGSSREGGIPEWDTPESTEAWVRALRGDWEGRNDAAAEVAK